MNIPGVNLSYWQKNRDITVIVLMFLGGALLTILTASITVDVNVFTFAAFVGGGIAFTYYSYLISVKFYSYLVIAENMRTTTFKPQVEVVHDDIWNSDIALVYGGGYNSPGRAFSYPDIEPGKRAIELFAVFDPFMVETVGNDHFILIRGKAEPINSWEKKEFLKRPSIRAALKDKVREVKTLYFVQSSTTMHPDTMPEETAMLDDFSAMLGRWQTEIQASNIHTEEWLDRRIRTADRARQKRKPTQQPEQEEKNARQ